MPTNANKKHDECLDRDNLISIEEASSRKSLLNTETVLSEQNLLVETEVCSDLSLSVNAYFVYPLASKHTSCPFIEVIVAKYIENIKASVLLLRLFKLF